MQNLLLKLIIIFLVGLGVSMIDMDARLKQACYVVIGLFVLVLLLQALFGITLF